MMFTKAKMILDKNDMPAKTVVTNEMEKYLNELFQICEKMYLGYFHSLSNFLNTIKTGNSIYEEYDKEYKYPFGMYFASNPTPTYKYCLYLAFDSIMHENYIGYYAAIDFIDQKLYLGQRLFFDDVHTLTYIILQICIESGFVEHNISFLNEDDKKNSLFYIDCMKNYFPPCGVIDHKDKLAIYLYTPSNYKDPLDLDKVQKNFDSCFESTYVQPDHLRTRYFIYDVDRYLGEHRDNSTMWSYLVRALLLHYTQQQEFHWDREFSKSLLKAMIGYSMCFDKNQPVKYTAAIKALTTTVLSFIKQILDKLSQPTNNHTNVDPLRLEIYIFLINMYFVFPLSEISDLIECDNENCLYSSLDISALVDTLESLGDMFQLDYYFDFMTGKVYHNGQSVDCGILKQCKVPNFTRVFVNLDMTKYSEIKLMLQFYDKNNQPICNDAPVIFTFSEDEPKDNVTYTTTILESYDIEYVKTVILQSTERYKQNTYINTNTYANNNYKNSNNKTDLNGIFSPLPDDEVTNDTNDETYKAALVAVIFVIIIILILCAISP